MDDEEPKTLSVIPPESLALNPDYEYLKKLNENNPYKAFIIIHATLQAQMKLALFEDKRNRWKGRDPARTWSLLVTTTYFRELTKMCLISGIIDDRLCDRLNGFNKDRNELIGHISPRSTKYVSDKRVKAICERGLELLRDLRVKLMDVLFERLDQKAEGRS